MKEKIFFCWMTTFLHFLKARNTSLLFFFLQLISTQNVSLFQILCWFFVLFFNFFHTQDFSSRIFLRIRKLFLFWNIPSVGQNFQFLWIQCYRQTKKSLYEWIKKHSLSCVFIRISKKTMIKKKFSKIKIFWFELYW